MAENIGGISWTVDADTSGAVNSTKQLDTQVNKVEKTLTKLDTKTTKTAKAVNKGIGGMGRTAGQAGIQMQQFIGQVQGGQNVMLALSSQAADLGFVLGAPLVGAVVGIAASLGGMLLPALMNGKTGLENVQKAVENVKAAMTLGAGGVIEYTAEMKKLKQISDALTEIKIASLIAEQNEAFKTGIKETIKLMDDARDRFALGQLFKDGSKEAIASFVALNESIEALKLDPTADSINNVEQALLGASRAGINSTKQGRALTEQMGGLIAEYKLGKISIEALQKALKDTDIVIDDSSKSTNRYEKVIANLKQQMKIAGLEFKGLTKDARIANATFKAKEILGGDATVDQINRVAWAMLNVAEAQENVKDRKTAITTTESIISRGDSPEDEREKERASLEASRADGLISAKKYQDALNQIDQEGLKAKEQIAAMTLGSFSNSFDQLANVLKESEGEQSSAYKAMFVLAKTFAIAQSGLNLALAISNAMASGPFPYNLAAMATVAAAGVGVVAAVAGSTYSGRENGGSVIGGQTYEVGEKNKPELLMIPGNNGRVMSNADMKSAVGGGNVGGNVSVNLYGAPAGTSVESRRDPITEERVIDIVINQMTNSNSEGRRGMQNNSNVHGVLNGRRRS